MNYRITEKILCLPPHLSTTWEQVAALRTEESGSLDAMTLVIHLTDGGCIKIPDLDSSVLDIIFSCHVDHLEKRGKSPKENKVQNTQAAFFQNAFGLSPEQLSQLSIRLGPSGIGGIAGGIEGMESAMSHDPTKTDTPQLPKEMLEKISQIAKILTGGELNNFPKPEPHCNCVHCQLSRAIHCGDVAPEKNLQDEFVSDDDLKFRDWEIMQTGDRLYRVTHPLLSVKYDVYLGDPIGCTCGEAHCDHIKAVLFSPP